jgi:hypothetical protein
VIYLGIFLVIDTFGVEWRLVIAITLLIVIRGIVSSSTAIHGIIVVVSVDFAVLNFTG